MIEVVLNDRVGKKVRVKCNDDDTIGDLKKLVAAQTGTRADKIRIQKWYTIYKDHITLNECEIHGSMSLKLYYNQVFLRLFISSCLILVSRLKFFSIWVPFIYYFPYQFLACISFLTKLKCLINFVLFCLRASLPSHLSKATTSF